MKIGSNALAADWGSAPDPTVTQVQPGETLSQIATRLNISQADLQAANPQIADPNQLSPGSDVHIPAQAQPAENSTAPGFGGNADGGTSRSSKYMESQLTSSMMRSMLSSGGNLSSMPANDSPGGSGGITQMPPVADPVGERASQGNQDDLKASLHKAYSTAEHLGVHHEDIVSMLHTMSGNPPLTEEKMTRALHLMFMAKDLPPADRKLVDGAFQASHGDPTQVEALSKLVADPKFTNASTQTKKEWLDKFKDLANSPEVQNLGPEEKSIVTQALTSDPPPSADKIKSTLDVIHSAKDLSPGDRKLFLDGMKAAGGDPAYAANLQKLIEDPKFKSLKPAEKTAVLSQTKNYATPDAVNNIDRLVHKDWFRSESLDDKQRSLKTIGRLSTYVGGDKQVIGNTLDKLLGQNSPIKVQWRTYPTSAKHGTTFGDMGDNVLSLNQGKIPAGNDKLHEDDDTLELAIGTTNHEVNHYVNHDKVSDTFHYFEAEYRAWFTQFKAEHGRPPTNQEAMDQRISWQLNTDSSYGQYAAAAMKNPKEAQKFYDFLSQMTGMKVDAKNWKAAVKSDPATWPDKGQSTAPVPSGNLDNH
jgi:LysM repeat protein